MDKFSKKEELFRVNAEQIWGIFSNMHPEVLKWGRDELPVSSLPKALPSVQFFRTEGGQIKSALFCTEAQLKHLMAKKGDIILSMKYGENYNLRDGLDYIIVI